jgi:hypothetical protein|tara:strand:+ start:2229 stop:2867 length:639 start_codon:yes stop_codon:yes gene_type:complete
MPITKHLGRTKSTGSKVAVIFREIYDENGTVTDPNNALVVDTDTLPNMWVDSFMDAVLSTEGQDTINFFEVAMRKTLPDGRVLLRALVDEGRMRKVRTNEIIMEPDKQVRIPLDELNRQLVLVAAGEEEVEAVQSAQSAMEGINRREAEAVNMDGTTISASEADMRAFQMRTQATMLREDANKLEAEAEKLVPLEMKPKRGRPKKVATADAK